MEEKKDRPEALAREDGRSQRRWTDSSYFVIALIVVPLVIPLALLGWAGWLAHPLALACIPLAMAWLQRFQIQPEERILEQRFGEAFRRYRQRVRRWL